MHPELLNPSGHAESASQLETLVPDSRSTLTPAQMVERKLVSLLRGVPLPVSQLQTTRRRSGGS